MRKLSQALHYARNDLGASFVVYLVALPLAIGIATASGYPPVAGIVTGIVGGLVVGLFSGAPLQVSGATASLAVVVADGVAHYGLPLMGQIIVVAGILQIAMALLRMGGFFQRVSTTVMQGMLSGVGILIIANQSKAITNEKAMALAAIVIGVMFLWPKIARGRLLLIPAPLLGVLLAAGVAQGLNLDVARVELPKNFLTGLTISAPHFSQIFTDISLMAAAVQLALIASAESLLCAGALDLIHKGPRTRYNRELAAQGAGNLVCGLLGALPLAGVILRSSANIYAGAKSRASTMMHGLWLLLALVAIPGLLQMIPLAALAGLLLATGAKLVINKNIGTILRGERKEVVVFATTVGMLLAVDLVVGVGCGLLVHQFFVYTSERKAKRAAAVPVTSQE